MKLLFFPLLGTGMIPAFRLKLMTETQKSIHHSDESDLPRGDQAARLSLTLLQILL